ncbi:MAG TPA: CBS domain-containing protein [Pyrinomonadaceae bacterium]|nr:CBS domain-containing protein [Pyrinomonadaceae bacterium]
MSRYRDDDRGYYGEGPRGRDWGSEERYTAERGDYGRVGSPRDLDYGYDSSRTRGRAFGGGRDYGREEFGREGGFGRGRYGERADYDYDEPRYGGYGRGYEREDEGRSVYEEGRDYLRRTFGGRERGASRSRLRCRDIMTKDVTVATRDATLEEVARMMKNEDTGVIPVVEHENVAAATTDTALDEPRRGNGRTYGNGKLIGLITDRDIVVRALAAGKDPRITRAEEIMTEDIYSAQPNDRVIDAIRKMGDKQVRRIPVVDSSGNLRGIISMADIALETEEDRELADALEEISSGASFWSKIFG